MSKNYDAAWDLIEQLDDISAELSDLLDDERDKNARSHLLMAKELVEAASKELEEVNPDRTPDDPLIGSVIIGRFIR